MIEISLSLDPQSLSHMQLLSNIAIGIGQCVDLPEFRMHTDVRLRPTCDLCAIDPGKEPDWHNENGGCHACIEHGGWDQFIPRYGWTTKEDAKCPSAI